MEGSRPEDPRSAGETRPQVPPEPGAPGPSGVPSARSQQLLTLRRGGNGAAPVGTRDPAAASPGQGKQGNMVMVWPQLVSIEFVAILVFTAMLLVLGTLVNAPLDLLANPDRTPNPSKAPWYFLNLQELLLHMHPALAGVIVPGVVVFVAIPLIPYIDRDTRDVGKWFGTAKAVPIAIFSAIFTAIVIPLEIFYDQFIGHKPMMVAIANFTGLTFLESVWMTDVFLGLLLMLGPIWILLRLIRWVYGPPTTREVMIALWTGFVVAYVLLTIFGTFFRGQGMELYWFGDPRLVRID